MKCFSYVVARDYGFAPNPFGRYCTLATCKPGIRNSAQRGDWVIGTSSIKMGYRRKLVFAMKVSEKINFNDYWQGQRFQYKKPILNGSLKQMYGDNIYSFNEETNEWCQTNSHHSNHDGSPNHYNMERDLKSKFVLISEVFYYFGKSAIDIPNRLRNNNGIDICVPGRGYKYKFPGGFIKEFLVWVTTSFKKGYHGNPNQFDAFERYDGIA